MRVEQRDEEEKEEEEGRKKKEEQKKKEKKQQQCSSTELDRFSSPSGFQSQAVAGLQEGQRHPPLLAAADAATAGYRILVPMGSWIH